MRFLALALFFVAAVSFCEATTVDELIKMANDAEAPFTNEALKRLNNKELWGAKRANSSVDVVIINASEKRFKSISNTCSFGSRSAGLLAEQDLHGHASTVLGVQSSEDNQDLGCNVFYVDPASMTEWVQKSTFFRIVLDNTLSDENYVYINSTPDLKVTEVAGQGKNSQVVIMVSDNSVGPRTLLSQQGTALVLHRKPKGSRNVFVKASKRGSRVRSI